MIGIILANLIIVVFVGITWWRKRPKNYPPGPPSYPIVGNVMSFGSYPLDYLLKLIPKYGSIVAIDFGNYPAVVVSNHLYIKELLQLPASSGKPALLGLMEGRTWTNKRTGIVSSTGVDFVQHKYFLMETLRSLGYGTKAIQASFLDEVDVLINSLKKKGGEDQGIPIESHLLFHGAAVNSLWNLISGDRFEQNDPQLKALVNAVSNFVQELGPKSPILFFPWLTKIAPNSSGWRTYETNVRYVTSFMEKEVERYIENMEPLPSGPPSPPPTNLIEAYLRKIDSSKDDPNSIFYRALGRANLVTTMSDLFSACSESVATTLSWAVLHLIKDRDAQRNLHSEIDRVVGKSDRPTLLHKDRMPFAKAVIFEVQRLSSIYPLAQPHQMAEDTQFHGYNIPKNTLIIPNLYAVHRDRRIWGDDVDEFRPDRFISVAGRGKAVRLTLKPNSHEDHVLLPYSIGRRSCIGESWASDQLFLFLVSLFQQFQFLPDPKDSCDIDTTFDQTSYVLTPRPYNFVIKPRVAV